MQLEDYFNMPNVQMPLNIAKALDQAGSITKTNLDNKNSILSTPSLQGEVGFTRMENGDYLVSMICPMPNVTKEMIDWWFWWHPQDSVRYQLWYPGEHFGISYSKKDKDYFSTPEMPSFQPNTQYPIESIGNIKMTLAIEFITPEMFGFDSKSIKQNDVATIVCGHVGAYKGLIQHTEMAHIYFQRENGLFLVSRFWLGKRLKNPLIRKFMLTDETALGMATHCCVEYRNLAEKLPKIYKENHR